MGEGGAESLVKDYGLLIDREQFNLQVLTVYDVKESTTKSQLTGAGIRVQSILPGCNLPWKLIKWFLGFIYVPLVIKKVIKDNGIDVVHVHMNQLHHLVPLMSFLKPIKVIYTVHNEPDIYFRRNIFDFEYRAVNKFKHKENFYLISLHEKMAGRLSDMFGFDRIITIRNGVDLLKFSNVKQTKQEIRDLNGIPSDAYVVGHVGRFTEQKNHTFIVDLFLEVLKHKPDAYLLLVGSGPLREVIIDKLNSSGIEGKFQVLSYRQDIPELLKAMDVFILPSLYEGLPVSLVEAQMAKLPCVVSDNINPEAVILPSTRLLSLQNDSIAVWAENVVHVPATVEWNERIQEFDMRREIKSLEALYQE